MNRVDEAVNLFRSGCACSQAILSVYAESLGLDRALAMRLSAGFAGGMRRGDTCGAVTGAYMVLGLLRGKNGCDKPEDRKEVYAAMREFNSLFESRTGSLKCKELLGCDVGTTEGLETAQREGLYLKICPDMVKAAVEILDEIMVAD